MKNSRSRIEILFDLVMIAVNLILVIKYLSYCLWFSFSGENVSDFCTTLIDKPTDGQHPCHEWLKSTTPSGSCRIDEYYVIEAFEMRERRHWQMRQKKPIRSYMLPLGSRETIVEIGMTRNLFFFFWKKKVEERRSRSGYNVVCTFFIQLSENANAMLKL